MIAPVEVMVQNHQPAKTDQMIEYRNNSTLRQISDIYHYAL